MDGTIYDNFLKSVADWPDNEALAWQEDGQYKVIVYSQLSREVKYLAAGLAEHGLKAGDKIALLASNGPHWIKVDLACARLGAIIVPIHTTYNFDLTEKIIRQ